MSNIEINNCVYKVHPVYNLYASDENGNIIHLVRQVPSAGQKHKSGYLACMVRKHGQNGQKGYYVHRFVYECFNGIIPDGKVIDHVNNIKDDNRLCNLQLMSHQENCKKSAKRRDYTFAAKNHQNKKCVKATNSDTNEVSYYNSMYAIHQHLGINAGIVKMVCEGINNCKTGISKQDNCHYKFEYVKKKEMPDDHKKSANVRPIRVSVEDRKKRFKESVKRWQNKEYKCFKCGGTFKNGYMFIHKKKSE